MELSETRLPFQRTFEVFSRELVVVKQQACSVSGSLGCSLYVSFKLWGK